MRVPSVFVTLDAPGDITAALRELLGRAGVTLDAPGNDISLVALCYPLVQQLREVTPSPHPPGVHGKMFFHGVRLRSWHGTADLVRVLYNGSIFHYHHPPAGLKASASRYYQSARMGGLVQEDALASAGLVDGMDSASREVYLQLCLDGVDIHRAATAALRLTSSN